MSAPTTLILAVAGFLLLAASLAIEKRAGWAAVAGLALLTVLAACESDPLLALGALALAAARFFRTVPKDRPAASVPEAPDGSSGKRP